MYTHTMNSVLKIEQTKTFSAEIRKKRVACYARVSTSSDEQLESLSAQKDHYEALIKTNSEWSFAGLYYDEGISGTEMTHRKGLLALIADCERGLIDHIVVKSVSRLARNTVDSITVVRKLRSLGVTIFFEREGIDTATMGDELMLSVMSCFAEAESHSLAENVKWSFQKKFRDGTYAIATAPYGYSTVDGKLVVNPAEAETVKFIFKSYLNGIGSTKIASQLNAKGIKPRRLGQWNDNSVRFILLNEKYSGSCLFQKSYTDERFIKRPNKGEREQFFVAEHHEALVSREDFDKVSALLESRRKIANAKCEDECYRNRYPFSGKVFCAQCGSSYKRSTIYNGDHRYAVMICRSHVGVNRKCSAKAVREEALEAAFTTMFNKLVFARDLVIKPYVESLSKSAISYDGESRESIKAKLDENLRRRKILSNLYAQGLIEQSMYLTENNALLSEAADLSLKAKKCTAFIDGKFTTHAAAIELLKVVNTSQVLTTFSPELFDQIVHHVTVLSRNQVEFSLRCGLNLKEEI